MATRTVTGTLQYPSGLPWANARLRFRLTPGSFTATAQHPSATVNATTDEDGAFSLVLWANETGGVTSVYEVTFPSGEIESFTIPAGSDPIDLSLLREAGVTPSDAQYPALLTYIQGNPEFRGEQGEAATVSVGTVTTGAPGTAAIVGNSGTPGAAVLDFTLPRGQTGTAGAAATVTVGAVSTVATGNPATVTNTGTAQAAVLSFAIPEGQQGIQGAKGNTGNAGAAATVGVGAVTTGAAGSAATVTNTGSSSAAVLAFTIPAGATGAAGTPGVDAPLAVAVADVATGRTLALGDVDSMLRSTSATAVTFTVPTDAAVAWPVGRAVAVVQAGAGQVTFAAASGVTLNGTGTKTRAQFSTATLVKTGANSWLLIGDTL